LSSALKSIDSLGLRGKIAIVGIAKRLEEIYFPEDPIPLYLDKKSESLKVIQFLRNEAHRFGIKLHRNKRSKKAIQSGLDVFPGIGPKTKETLLKKFKSFKRIKEANKDDLIHIIGNSKGTLLFNQLQENFRKK
jgi:excinuclease ABC subunit C